MWRLGIGWAGLAALLALAGPAASQYGGRGGGRGDRPAATFFVKDGYAGRSVSVDRPVRSFREFDMQDKISSIMIQGGRWLVCEHDDFRGRCETIDRSIRHLANIGFDDMISSARPLDGFGGGPDDGRPGYDRPGYGYGDRPGYGGGRPGYGGGEPLPAGSWAGSCRNASIDGGMLSAQCNDGRGNWHFTQAKVRDCRSGRYGNRFGDLVCDQ